MADRIRTIARHVAARRAAEEGQGLAEYALIIAFIAIVCAAGLSTLGSTLAASPAWTLP